jgi:IclR family acetate operon transcriptional repressor
VGKLFLAFCPDVVEPVDDEPERFTDHTATSPEALAREVERIQRQGFAENREEWIPGLAVVAAPVRVGGRLVGALAVAAPIQRLDALGREQLSERTMAAAGRVAARLEGSGT